MDNLRTTKSFMAHKNKNMIHKPGDGASLSAPSGAVIACWLTLGLLSVHFFTDWKIGEAAPGLSFLLCMSAVFSDVIFDTCARIFSPNAEGTRGDSR